MTTTDGTFNWHELDQDSVLYWMLPMVLRGDKLRKASEASNDFENCKLTMQLNGIELDAKNFLDRLLDNMRLWAAAEAERIVKEETSLAAVEEVMYEIRKQVEQQLRGQLRDAGIELREDY